jgi:hypothetical protein
MSQSPHITASGYDDGMGLCGWLLAFMSWMIVVLTFPFSICFCLKVRGFLGRTFSIH